LSVLTSKTFQLKHFGFVLTQFYFSFMLDVRAAMMLWSAHVKQAVLLTALDKV